MNNLNEHKNLKAWCDNHYENTKIRVHPSNVPVGSLLDELLGRVLMLEAALSLCNANAKADGQRLLEMEERMKIAEKRIEQKRRIKVAK